MADEQQAQDAVAALSLTNELLAAVDAYIGCQADGEMSVSIVADGVAGLAGSVAASGAELLQASGEVLSAELLPLEMCRVLLGMQGREPQLVSEPALLAGGLSEAESAQAAVLRADLEVVLNERAEQEKLSVDIMVEAVADLLLRTVMRVAQQLGEAGDRAAVQRQRAACYRLVHRCLDTLAGGAEGDEAP